VFVVDAMTDRDAEAHGHTVEKIFPRLGQVDITENVLKLAIVRCLDTGDLVTQRGALIQEASFLEKPVTRSSLLKKVCSTFA
jgi:hypothetical protein